MPAGNAQKIRFAPDGAIYIAPTGGGLELPADVGDGVTAPTGYKALGYATEDGVTLTPAIETTPLNAWQSAAPVVYTVESASFQLQATLLEASKLVTESFFGATWVALEEGGVPTGEYRLDLSTNPELQEFSIVVDWKHKDNLWRVVIPRAMVSDRGGITLRRTEAQQFELTVDAMDDSGKLGYVLTNEDMSDTP